MSKFIQIPNLILCLTKRSKHEEAFVYAAIRNEIKDDSRKASCSEKMLGELLGCTERTINTYVANLKQAGLLRVAQLKQGRTPYPYNVYQFDSLDKDYFYILPSFIYDGNISAKLKGLLLFIKANCWKGTNYIRFSGKTTDLAQMLGVGKNIISGYLDELKSKGYIRFIGKSLHITDKRFPLSMNDKDMWNTTYEIIYDYCLTHNRIPPVKNVDKKKDKALSWIVAEYMNENDKRDKSQRQDQLEFGRLKNALNERCTNLPENLTLEYFCQALVNKLPHKDTKPHTDITL